MMKNAFYFILKALLVLKIFLNFCVTFWPCKKRLELKDKVNFKIYAITAWLTNSYITHIVQYLTN